MRQLYLFLPLLIAFPSIFSKAAAQDTIQVEPGTGTLEAAIAEHGGDKVYSLKAGERYTLESILEVSNTTLGGAGKTLTIVGDSTDGMPAVIQVANKADGSVQPQMFILKADFTIRNIFISDQDNSGMAGKMVFSLEARIRLIMDNCVIDPAGTNRTFAGSDQADRSVFYLTNSQIYRNGHMEGANDGGWLGGMSWDTLWVENNTLVSSGQDFIGTPFHNVPNNQFIWVNHNTFLWHDVWIKKSYTDQNFFFTNNLMHDISLFPELPRWYKFFPDFDQGNNLLCQTAIDTIEINGVPKTLPSDRKMFWEYNLMYYSPGVQEVPKYAADNDIELAYLIPMVWDEDVPLSYTGGVVVASPEDSCRENRILADDVNWPHMKYNHNWYDIDPLYNDPMIYSINDSVGEHILGFYRGVYWEEEGAPAVSDLPSYNWDIDDWNGIEPANFPYTWPRFDGTYTHAGLLTASIEGLPLGDLNWYPNQKEVWYANKELIERHILELNENSYELLAPDSIVYSVVLSILDEASHPVPDAVLMLGEDTLVWANNDGLILMDTLAGTYTITVSADGYIDYTDDLEISYASVNRTIILQKPLFELLFVVINGSDSNDSIVNAAVAIEDVSGTLLTDIHGMARININGNINYTVSKPGFFDKNGAVTVAQASVEVVELDVDRTGISDIEKGILIYPNPASDYLVVEAEAWVGGNVQLINLLGTTLKETVLTFGSVTMSLDGLNRSLCFIRISKGNKNALYKVVISK